MKTPDYHAQTADLIEAAFQDFPEGLTGGTPAARGAARADLKVKAAQAIATLALARETRFLALAHLAGVESVGGDAPAPEIARESYALAALGLGLIDDEPEEGLSREELLTALGMGQDPADADLGDLQ